MFSPLIDELMASLRCLPGVGPKSAQRMALHLLERDRPGAERHGREHRERQRQLSDEAGTALRQAQRNWIAMRDAECKPYGEDQPYSVFGEFSYDCMVRLTLDRARQLAVVRGDQS